MVRNYKRKTNLTERPLQPLQRAAEAVKQGKSFRKAADKFGVTTTRIWRTLKRLSKGKTQLNHSQLCRTRQVFSDAEETILVAYLIKASRIGFPLDTVTLRSLAYDLAERNNKNMPASWSKRKRAGKDWVMSFRKRHTELTIRVPEATSIARAAAFNTANVNTFFEKLKQLYMKHSFTPERVFNVDETALSTCHKPQKVITESGVKQVSQLVSQERGETVTMLGIVNAIGNAIPPCLIFPRVHFKDSMLMNAPAGAQGFANTSGWMNKDKFVDCLRHSVQQTRCSPEEKVLVILDNHESHVSLQAVDYCQVQVQVY